MRNESYSRIKLAVISLTFFAFTAVAGEVQRGVLDQGAVAGVQQGFPAFVVSRSTPDGRFAIVAAGMADMEKETPVSQNDGFHIASITKTVTATAVLKLVDEGRIGFESRLVDLLPATLIDAIPFHERMTVRQLLTHRSGIYSPNNDPAYWVPLIGPGATMPFYWSSEDIVHFADEGRNAPLFEPGEGQAYGDINYVLLSLIVEAVSGTPYKQFVEERIFHPVGMARTWFLSDLQKRKPPPFPRVRAYTLVSDIILDAFAFDDSFQRVAGGLAETSEGQERSDGAAGIISTAADLDRFFRALFGGRLLSAGSTAFLLGVADEASKDGSLEVLRSYQKPYGTIVTAEGDGPGTNAIVAYRPKDGVLVVALTNLFGRFDESDYIFETALPAAFAGGD